ncbi:MAG: hypothetical protein YHS30scaffold324_25 [Catenulispora phage 69_17]|jgi:hypothetical protein|nr:MAG: hypothetical protein YHS30scaffold324_25 [Catenulispora phage 69_17]
MTDRHPGGRTCAGAAATLTALVALLTALVRKAAR